jgi:hypothetical protein
MNTTLTIPRPVNAVRRPAPTFFVALLLSFASSLFAPRDEPFARRYVASKYNGEFD